MTSPSESSTEALRPAFVDMYPVPEDWVALQGGKPRIFRNPHKPDTRWIVLHVYEEHGDVGQRFQSGLVVDTLPPRGKIQLLHKVIQRHDDEGRLIERGVVIPSIMDRSVHGDYCEDRSSQSNGGTYNRIGNQQRYEEYLQELSMMGMEELRFTFNRDGFVLQAYPEIRPARPLGD